MLDQDSSFYVYDGSVFYNSIWSQIGWDWDMPSIIQIMLSHHISSSFLGPLYNHTVIHNSGMVVWF